MTIEELSSTLVRNLPSQQLEREARHIRAGKQLHFGTSCLLAARRI